MRRTLRHIILAAFILGLTCTSLADDAVTTGELTVEPPTLICLGFEWRIEGDENANATARVRYREKGGTEWRESLPLYRVGRGRHAHYGFGGNQKLDLQYRIPDALCGSILDLKPGTEYEVALTATDPDGVKGEAVKRVNLKTRAEPEIPQGGEVRHVYASAYKGEKQEPSYLGIMHAVNGFNPWCDCYQTVHPDRAKPGTVIKLHAGVYKMDRFHYWESFGGAQTLSWLHGTLTLIPDGTPDKPIAIVAAGDGEVIIDGSGCDTLFNIRTADYLHFEGLTIRNARVAFHGGFQGEDGCEGLTVKNCRIEHVQYGVLAQDARSEGFYIADNTFIGSGNPDQVKLGLEGDWGVKAVGYAVNLAGRGHVVCYNRARSFWDGINIFTNSLADPALGQQSRAIDFYNNDISCIGDNFIETDGGYCNLRVLRNRCFNAIIHPLSMQPVYAGPVYWIRNVVYNAFRGRGAFKVVNVDNFIAYHNTSTCNYTAVSGARYLDVRNNLFMGSGKPMKLDGSQTATVIGVGYQDPRSIFDYNGHRTSQAPDVPFLLVASGRHQARTFADLANFGAEQHGVALPDYRVFAGAQEPNHASDFSVVYEPDAVDLRPAEGSPIIDAGCVIPGVNDDFSGNAPDLGAYEYGKPVPHYGPRTEMLRQDR